MQASKTFGRGRKEESFEKSKLSNVVPHIGEFSNQYKDELMLLYKIKHLLPRVK
jgi:hypothetical protein